MTGNPGIKRFEGKRTPGFKLFAIGLLGGILCAAVCAVLEFVYHRDVETPLLAALGICWFFVFNAFATFPRNAWIEVDSISRTIKLSWRRTPIDLRDSQINFGKWINIGLNTQAGYIAHISKIRIGSRDHDGLDYPSSSSPCREVDIEIKPSDFDDFIRSAGWQALPFSKDGSLPLVSNTTNLSGVVKMMAPWIFGPVITLPLGIILGVSGIITKIQQLPYGDIYIAIAFALPIVGSMIWSLHSCIRIQNPDNALVLSNAALSLLNSKGELIACAAWPEVSAAPFTSVRYWRYGVLEVPVIELRIGTYKTIRVGAWKTDPEWYTVSPQRTLSSAQFLMGNAHWTHLVQALQTQACLGVAQQNR